MFKATFVTMFMIFIVENVNALLSSRNADKGIIQSASKNKTQAEYFMQTENSEGMLINSAIFSEERWINEENKSDVKKIEIKGVLKFSFLSPISSEEAYRIYADSIP
jgi:hypothetical protein